MCKNRVNFSVAYLEEHVTLAVQNNSKLYLVVGLGAFQFDFEQNRFVVVRFIFATFSSVLVSFSSWLIFGQSNHRNYECFSCLPGSRPTGLQPKCERTNSPNALPALPALHVRPTSRPRTNSPCREGDRLLGLPRGHLRTPDVHHVRRWQEATRQVLSNFVSKFFFYCRTRAGEDALFLLQLRPLIACKL